MPGQFQFVTFLASEGLPAEEHHFTIASSPALAGSHTSTIKASGDFTAQIDKVKPGDPVAIEAPFGRFSHVFYPESQDLVFIAGGIGITPLMSNLRHMRDTGTRRRVLLLYVNRGEADIVFKEELDHMAGKEAPQLEIVHVLTQPGSNGQGESGRLDREKLSRLCGAPQIQRLLPVLPAPHDKGPGGKPYGAGGAHVPHLLRVFFVIEGAASWNSNT